MSWLNTTWDKVFQSDKVIESLQAQLKEAIQTRSELLKDISDNVGRGPFQVNDLHISIQERETKSGEESTYFYVKKQPKRKVIVLE